MTHPLQQVLQRDPRYPLQAYEFVSEALNYAHEVMGLGIVQGELNDSEGRERHLTGQELCEAGRRFASEQYGMMAKVVLNTWGISSTNDIGELVYNMINVDLMRKSPNDRREDFNDVYDFEKVFQEDFDFAASQPQRGPSAASP